MKWNVVSELDVVLFLAICLLVPFVSGQSFKRRSNGRSLFLARPGHMLCVDPCRSKWPLVLCCQAIIIYHVLIWLSFLLLTIQGNLQLLPFILLKIDPSRNISSISRHSPCKKPCYSLIGNIYPAELWSEQSGRGMKMRSPPTFPWCVWILPT